MRVAPAWVGADWRGDGVLGVPMVWVFAGEVRFEERSCGRKMFYALKKSKPFMKNNGVFFS